MTREFINAHCVDCDYCIYTDGEPWGCGEIDDGGCCSEDLQLVKCCRLGHEPIEHKPRFTAGDRLNGCPNPIRIIMVVTGIDGFYLTQMEGGCGKFGEPYPEKKMGLEEVDYAYEPVEEGTPVPLTDKEGRLARILWPGFLVSDGMTVEGYALLKRQEEKLMSLFGVHE